MRLFFIVPLLLVAGLVAWYAVRSEPALPADASAVIAPASVPPVAQAYLLPLSNPSYAPIRNTTIADPQVDATVALVEDLDSGQVLYQKNADLQVPIASLTKLVSALVVTQLFTPDEIVTVASDSIRVDQQRQTLYAGERMRVGDLVSMMLVESSNDAAYALAAHARGRGIDFVARMNETAVALGMTKCTLKDPAGLDDTSLCTAHDLVRLVRAIQRDAPGLWAVTLQPTVELRSLDGTLVHEVKNTNELLTVIPGIVGGKTGNTDGALGCLILLVKSPTERGTLVSIILGSRSRFTDTTALLQWAPHAYQLSP